MRKSMVKKIGAFALAGAMMLGMTGSVMAYDVDYYNESHDLSKGIGHIYFTLESDYDNGYVLGETKVKTNYEADRLYAYAYVEFYGVRGGGYYELADEEARTSITESCKDASVEVRFTINRGNFIGTSVESTHKASIGDKVDSSCWLGVEE